MVRSIHWSSLFKFQFFAIGNNKGSIECFHSRGQHICKFIGTKESVCIRKEFNSQRIGLGHQHGRHFIVLGHQYGRRDVMWKHSIGNKKTAKLIGAKNVNELVQIKCTTAGNQPLVVVVAVFLFLFWPKRILLSTTFCGGGSTHTSLHFIPYCIEAFLTSKSLLVFTLGTRGFFSRVTRTFIGRKPTRLRPKAEETSGEAARKKFFAPVTF